MPDSTPRKNKEQSIQARCSASLKQRLIRAADKTGQDESMLVRVALARFFKSNRTPKQILAAVLEAQAEEAA